MNCGEAKHLCEAMLWRMLPAFGDASDAVVCRDLDVIPGPLDRMAVEEWLASGRAIHVVHFASAHSGIMGGTTSVRPKKFRELLHCYTFADFISRGHKAGITFDVHGDDQHLLNMHHSALTCDMLIHELDHDVGDLPAVDIRHEVSALTPSDIPIGLVRANSISKGIGVCDDPTEATVFYDGLDLDVIRLIQRCERD